MTLIRRIRWWLGQRIGSRGDPNRDTRKRYSRYLGFHADEDNGLEDPRLVTRIFELCDVSPANMDGAQALFRHIVAADFEDLRVQRQAAANLGCEAPTIVFVPFTTQDPGTNDATQNNAALAVLATQVALYKAENANFIAAFGNLNSENFMVGSSAAVRNAAWWALEGRAINEVFEPQGVRWCASDDQGIVSLCQTLVARRAAWTSAGATANDCQFFATHCYVDAGFVPSHLLLAEASFTRASVTTPIRVTELAYGFLGVGNEDEDKPWLFEDWALGTAHPQSLTWTRILCEWFRVNQRRMLIFDWTMFVRNYGSGPTLSPWGTIFVADQDTQPNFVEPTPGTLWWNTDAETRAYSLRLSNGGTTGEAETAAAWVAAGNLFTLAA